MILKFPCDLDLVFIAELLAFHKVLLRSTFDQSLIEIRHGVMELLGGQEIKNFIQ